MLYYPQQSLNLENIDNRNIHSKLYNIVNLSEKALKMRMISHLK